MVDAGGRFDCEYLVTDGSKTTPAALPVPDWPPTTNASTMYVRNRMRAKEGKASPVDAREKEVRFKQFSE